MNRTMFFTLVMLVTLAAVFAQPAQAGIVVGTCVAGTQYVTIQEAINASTSGAMIKVCPAYYMEQIYINHPLTLVGVSSSVYDAPVIASPSTGLIVEDHTFAPQVLIADTTGANLTNLAIDGANNGLVACGGVDGVGILYHNASGTVNKVTFRNQIIPGAPHGCDHFRGVMATVDASLAASVTVENSVFRNFGYEAIRADQPGLSVTIANNYVAGVEAAHHSGNGIAIHGGATGSVTGNTVSNEVWIDNVSPDFFGAAWGIFVGCSTGVTVSGNTVTDTQGGIVLDCATSNNNIVTGNKIFNTKGYDGIYIGGNNNMVQKNTISGAGQSGIHVDTSLGGGGGNTVTGNTITDSCAGLLTSPGVLNILRPNTYSSVFITVFQNPTCGPIF
jgi:parallel beta-helix repeat protein